MLFVQGEMLFRDDITTILQQRIVECNAIDLNEHSDISIFVRQLVFASIDDFKVETLLGTETSFLIVNLFEGINSDVLCVVSGLLM